MKCTTSHIITFLILLALSQSVVITYLLSIQQNNGILDSIEIVRNSFGATEETKIIETYAASITNSTIKSKVETPQYVKTNENNLKLNDQYLQKYDGVADD